MLVSVAHFYDPEEAFVARSFLQSDGIACLVQNEYHLGVNPALRIALGGMSLQVLPDNAEQARQNLNEITARHNVSDGSSASVDTENRKAKKYFKINWFWLPVAFATGTAFPLVYRNKADLFIQSLFAAPFYIMLFLL